MRRVFKGGAVLALIAILAAPALYADDPPPPGTEPPSVRIRPPIGSASAEPAPESSTFFELLWTWLQVRIRPPIG